MRRFEVLRDGKKIGEGVEWPDGTWTERSGEGADTMEARGCSMRVFGDAGNTLRYLDPLDGEQDEPRPLALRNGVADIIVDELAKQYQKANIYASKASKWRFEALARGSVLQHVDADPCTNEAALGFAREVLRQAWLAQDRDEQQAPSGSVGRLVSERFHELLRDGGPGVGKLSSFEALCLAIDERLGRPCSTCGDGGLVATPTSRGACPDCERGKRIGVALQGGRTA